MTEKQAEVLETALVQSIDPAAHAVPIQFSATEYENGGLVFTCANKATKTWLYKIARKLVPWPGAKVTVGQAESTLNGARLVLRLVGVMRKRSSQQILDLLQKQNEGISTAQWKITNRVEETDKKLRLHIWIDEKSYVELKARKLKLHLGLSHVTFLPMWEWNKLKDSSTVQRESQLGRQNLPQRPAKNAKQNRATPWSQNLTSPWVQNPVSPWVQNPVSPWVQNPVSQSPWLASPLVELNNLLQSSINNLLQESSLGSWAVQQSQGPWLSDQNYSNQVSGFEDQRDLELANTLAQLLLNAHRMSSDTLLSQVRASLESALLQNLTPGFLGSEKPWDRGVGTSERSQLGEASYIVSDRAQHKEPRYNSDRPQENRHLSDRWQPHETKYGAPETPQLRDLRFTSSDQMPPRETSYVDSDQTPSHDRRYLSSNRALSRDSTYVTSNRDQSENLRFRSSNRPPPLLPRLTDMVDMDATVTETDQALRSTLSTSEHPREHGFDAAELPPSQEAAYSMSDQAQRRERRYTSDRAREDRYFTSDRHQPLESGYRALDAPQLRRTSHTSSDRALLRDTESATANRDRFHDSVMATSYQDKFRDPTSATSARDRFRGGVSASSDRDKFRDSVSVTANRDNSRNSRYVSPNKDHSGNTRFRGSGLAPSRVSRFSDADELLTQTVLQNLTSTLLTPEQPRERGFGMSELPEVREASYLAPDREQLREPRYTLDRPKDDTYSTSDRRQPRETVYRVPDSPQLRERSYTISDWAPSRESVALNRDRSENSRSRDSGKPRTRVSRFSDLNELPTETAAVKNLVSTLLPTELLQPQETSYIVSDRAHRTESRYSSDRAQDDEYSTSERRKPRETAYRTPDHSEVRETGYTASDRSLSRDSRFVPPTWDQSENLRSRGLDELPPRDSRLRSLGELPVLGSRFRGSDTVQSRESRFEDRDSLYPDESKSRLSDLQQLKEFDNTVFRLPRSQEDRFSGSDISHHRSRFSYTNSKHSRF